MRYNLSPDAEDHAIWMNCEDCKFFAEDKTDGYFICMRAGLPILPANIETGKNGCYMDSEELNV